MSLSSVVSSLVRAQMGSSVNPTVTDEDLDRHIADLIVKEAKAKAERYKTDGVRAYLRKGMDSEAPRANKRFLTSIIRSTDDHNKAVLKAQADAAAEVKAVRDEQERQERQARAQEAADASRRLMGGAHRPRDDERSEDRKGKRRHRSWERQEDEDDRNRERRRWHRGRSRSRSVERKDSRRGSRRDGMKNNTRQSDSRSRSPRQRHRADSKNETPDGVPCSTRPNRSRSRSADASSSSKRSRDRSPQIQGDDDRSKRHGSSSMDDEPLRKEEDLRRQLLKARNKRSRDDEPSESGSRHRSRSPSHSSKSHTKLKSHRDKSPEATLKSSSLSRSRSYSRSPTPGPPPPDTTNLPSKMDKYFSESYDPRLDVEPLPKAPSVPKTGLIDSAEFEGWEAMLELIRKRREDKEEKKRLQKLGFLDKDGKRKDKAEDLDKWGKGAGWNSASDIMDIEYKKRGDVREWDVGKDLSF